MVQYTHSLFCTIKKEGKKMAKIGRTFWFSITSKRELVSNFNFNWDADTHGVFLFLFIIYYNVFDKTRGWATTLVWNKFNTTVIRRVILNTDHCTLDQHLYYGFVQYRPKNISFSEDLGMCVSFTTSGEIFSVKTSVKINSSNEQHLTAMFQKFVFSSRLLLLL